MNRPVHPGVRNPYGTVQYHKGWYKDPVKYQLLAVAQYSKSEKDAIRAFIKPILTGDQAQQLIFETDPSSGKKGHELGWSYTVQDKVGRIGILAFRGREVALFIKRQVVEIFPEPGEPMPEGRLEEPRDAWQRLDLLGPSAREANLFLAQKHSTMTEEIKVLKQNAKTKELLIGSLETEKFKLEKALERKQVMIDGLNKKLAGRGAPQKKSGGAKNGGAKANNNKNGGARTGVGAGRAGTKASHSARKPVKRGAAAKQVRSPQPKKRVPAKGR